MPAAATQIVCDAFSLSPYGTAPMKTVPVFGGSLSADTTAYITYIINKKRKFSIQMSGFRRDFLKDFHTVIKNSKKTLYYPQEMC